MGTVEGHGCDVEENKSYSCSGSSNQCGHTARLPGYVEYALGKIQGKVSLVP